MKRYLNSPPPPGYKYDEASIRRGRGGRITKITEPKEDQDTAAKKNKVVLLDKVKDIFNSRCTTEIILNNNKPVLSFIMPWFRAQYLGWLPLEALCRQINIDFSWELIIIEENLENPFGLDNLKKYIDRLKKVNCVNITYISLREWIPLSCKWYYLIKQCDINSEIVAMNPHDIYFPNNRLHKQYYTLINSDFNWYKTAGNILYDIKSNKHVRYKYTSSDRPDTCLQTAKKEILDKLPLFYKTKGIDGERYKYLKKYLHYYYDTDEEWINKTININGLNNLSRSRTKKMNDTKEYLQLTTQLHEHLPLDISKKLKESWRHIEEYKNLVNNSNLNLPKYY